MLGVPRTLAHFSEAGQAFLKCAFASPDFSVDPGKGIPDNFHGRTLAVKDCYTTALGFTPDTDTYLLVAPVPGYAYFRAEVPIGNNPLNFVGVPFPTYTTNFGSGTDRENNFSKFRYASMAAGLYPTSNFMSFAGSIQAWRVDLNLAENQREAVNSVGPPAVMDQYLQKRIQGLQGVVPMAPRDNYSESFIKGAYTFAFDKSQDFEWNDFVSAENYLQSNNVSDKQLSFDGFHRLTGLGNVNSIVYKISTPLGATNTAIFRMWNCIELQPDTNSGLFQFSGVSPPLDDLALNTYHALKMRFPVAMPCAENAKFWETVLRVLQEVSRAGAYLPGPAGVMSGGLSTIVNSIAGLVL
jgi:hypothetical protein